MILVRRAGRSRRIGWNRFTSTALDSAQIMGVDAAIERPHFTSEGTKMDQKSSRPEGQSFGTGQFKDQKANSVSDSLNRGKDAVTAAANDAADSSGADLQAIRNDLNSLKDTLSRFMSQASNEAVKAARQVTSNVAGQVSDVASDLADRGGQYVTSASDQAKTFATELESMARRNPLGALAGAVAIGVLIGVMGRRS
jgi:ElaB/YqjD/DUF883 family membrane-anchored ribosome-binding protein